MLRIVFFFLLLIFYSQSLYRFRNYRYLPQIHLNEETVRITYRSYLETRKWQRFVKLRIMYAHVCKKMDFKQTTSWRLLYWYYYTCNHISRCKAFKYKYAIKLEGFLFSTEILVDCLKKIQFFISIHKQSKTTTHKNLIRLSSTTPRFHPQISN